MPFPVDTWVVEASLTGKISALAYLDSVLSQEILSIIVKDFENNIGEIMPLQDLAPLFKYFKGLVTTKMSFEAGTLAIMMQSDEHANP